MKITVNKRKIFWDFEKQTLDTRWPLNTVLLNTGSAVILYIEPYSIKWLYQWFVVFFVQESLWVVSEGDLGTGDQPDAYACDKEHFWSAVTLTKDTQSLNILHHHLGFLPKFEGLLRWKIKTGKFTALLCMKIQINYS